MVGNNRRLRRRGVYSTNGWYNRRLKRRWVFVVCLCAEESIGGELVSGAQGCAGRRWRRRGVYSTNGW